MLLLYLNFISFIINNLRVIIDFYYDNFINNYKSELNKIYFCTIVIQIFLQI